MTRFTATSTFLPLRVYCRGRGDKTRQPRLSLGPGAQRVTTKEPGPARGQSAGHAVGGTGGTGETRQVS